MKRLYYNGIEESQEIYIKILEGASLATADLLIRNSDNSWETKPRKAFDLNNEVAKTEFSHFKERYFEITEMEYEVARKQMIDHNKTTNKSNQGNFLIDAEEILKKIKEFRKNDSDEKSDL